jgi:hypothetical protein
MAKPRVLPLLANEGNRRTFGCTASFSANWLGIADAARIGAVSYLIGCAAVLLPFSPRRA